MKVQNKKIIYWINNIFFLSALMFFIVVYGSFVLSTIKSDFNIRSLSTDSIIPVVILVCAVEAVATIISLCIFRKIISKHTVIFQLAGVVLTLLPFFIHNFFFIFSNTSAQIIENSILTVLYATIFIITLIFFVKDSKRLCKNF